MIQRLLAASSIA